MKLNFKKFALATTVITAGLLSAPTAKADDNLTLYQANSFVEELKAAINSKDVKDTQEFLNLRIPNYGTFGSVLTSTVQPGFVHSEYGSALGSNGVLYYRYPGFAHSHYNEIGLHRLGKGDFITNILAKKHSVPNYSMHMEVMSSRKVDSDTVLLEVDVKEYSAMYHPHLNPLAHDHGHLDHAQLHGWTSHMHSNLDIASKCQVRLDKEMGSVYLTQMDCKFM